MTSHKLMTRIDIYKHIIVSFFFLLQLFLFVWLFFFFESGSHIFHARLKLTVWAEMLALLMLLSPSPKSWDGRCAPPYRWRPAFLFL